MRILDEANDSLNVGTQQPSTVCRSWFSHLHAVGHKDGCTSTVFVQTSHPTYAQRRNGRPETATSIQTKAQRYCTVLQYYKGRFFLSYLVIYRVHSNISAPIFGTKKIYLCLELKYTKCNIFTWNRTFVLSLEQYDPFGIYWSRFAKWAVLVSKLLHSNKDFAKYHFNVRSKSI